MRARSFLLSAFFVLAAAVTAQAQAQLVMFEEQGCVWCARWDAEVAHKYPKTAEGRAAPLRRADIHAPPPKDIALERRVIYSPTFVLVVDGHEVSRIEGYPGEAFFWARLERMIGEAGLSPAGSG